MDCNNDYIYSDAEAMDLLSLTAASLWAILAKQSNISKSKKWKN
ncbi:MAG: hypothetical protein ACI3ZS_04015 [Candidatus Cryptobacteroides sp.]